MVFETPRRRNRVIAHWRKLATLIQTWKQKCAGNGATHAPLPLCGIRLTPALSSKQAQRNRTDACIDYQNHGIIPLTGLTRSVAVQLTPATTRYTHRVSINFHRFTDQPFPIFGKMLPVAWDKSGKKSIERVS